MISKLKSLFKNAKVRLAGRAVVAGAAAFFVALNGSDYSGAAWKAAIVGAVLAGAEYVTPLNSLLGLFKQ